MVLPASICKREVERKGISRPTSPIHSATTVWFFLPQATAVIIITYRLHEIIRHAHRHLQLGWVTLERTADILLALHQRAKVRIRSGGVVVSESTNRHDTLAVQIGTFVQHVPEQADCVLWLDSIFLYRNNKQTSPTHTQLFSHISLRLIIVAYHLRRWCLFEPVR